jgi:hypothetical protein
MILWLDGDDEQGTRHLSFRLKGEGGTIGIFDDKLQLIDSITYPKQFEDISFGRESYTSSNLCYFPVPTPNQANNGGLLLPDPQKVPVFSTEGGFYNGRVVVEFSHIKEGEIYFTTDGTDPVEIKEHLYSTPLQIDSTTIVRARIIADGWFPGDIITKTYFVNENSTLPVVSLTTDPKNLWDKSKGIYHKYKKRGWERPANVEYFDIAEDGSLFPAFNNKIVIRIAGKTSRRQPKKSFVMHTKYQYGNPRINYQVFKDKPIDSFGSLWVRADATSGRNVPELWVGERFKNELLFEVNEEMGSTVDMQAYQPVLLFLNGEYWGLYNLMERKGADFIKDNHGYDDVDILTGEYERVVSGKSTYYDKLTKFIINNDIKDDSIYSQVGLLMDVPNYIDYWVYEVYSSTHDNRVNIRYWRPKGEGHKWRWISYDQDSWNKYDENSIKRFTEAEDVFLFTRLLKNETFRKEWANRMCDYLNTVLESENVIGIVDGITKRISNEIDREKERWQDTMLYMPANSRIDWFKEYAVHRPSHIRGHIMDYYGLEGKEAKITLDVHDGKGSIRVNSLQITQFPWSGYYISEIPIALTAEPSSGYKFTGWKGKKMLKTPQINITPSPGDEYIPVFKKRLVRIFDKL